MRCGRESPQGRGSGRWLQLAVAVALAGATGMSLDERGFAIAGGVVLGIPPGYGPSLTLTVPNQAAIDRAIWMPGLAAGWDPQGLAWAGGRLFVSAYESDSFRRYRGPCRVFRLDPATGHEIGEVDVPRPCGHAGGLAVAGDGRLFVADTQRLFAVGLDAFDGRPAAFRAWPLGRGLGGGFAASAKGAVWVGTYSEAGPGRAFEFPIAMLDRLPDGVPLTPQLAARALPVPSWAQGAAFAPDGMLWLARSDLAWGFLERLDPVSGERLARFPMPGGIEGLAFDPKGRLWAVSEAGARHLPLDYPFFPLVFRLDPARLRTTG